MLLVFVASSSTARLPSVLETPPQQNARKGPWLSF
jgi:hypothetical protein